MACEGPKRHHFYLGQYSPHSPHRQRKAITWTGKFWCVCSKHHLPWFFKSFFQRDNKLVGQEAWLGMLSSESTQELELVWGKEGIHLLLRQIAPVQVWSSVDWDAVLLNVALGFRVIDTNVVREGLKHRKQDFYRSCLWWPCLLSMWSLVPEGW